MAREQCPSATISIKTQLLWAADTLEPYSRIVRGVLFITRLASFPTRGLGILESAQLAIWDLVSRRNP
jgi:hypothetical protein